MFYLWKSDVLKVVLIATYNLISIDFQYNLIRQKFLFYSFGLESLTLDL